MFKVGDIVTVKDASFGLIRYERGTRYIVIKIVRSKYVQLADLLTLAPLQHLVGIAMGGLDSRRMETKTFSMDHFDHA